MSDLTVIQDRCWLVCNACAHVVFHVASGGPRPTGRPRPGDRCPECQKHGPNHQGRLVLVRAHLVEEAGGDRG